MSSLYTRVDHMCGERLLSQWSSYVGKVLGTAVDSRGIAQSVSNENVLAVHCRGGKGRTGSLCCSWLLYSEFQPNKDNKGVTSKSSFEDPAFLTLPQARTF